MSTLILGTAFFSVYDGEPVDDSATSDAGAAAAAAAAAEAAASKAQADKVKFTPEQQAFINSKLAEERRKATAKNDQLITQLETEKNRSGTTEAERQQLAERIDTLRAEYATKDELNQRETNKRVKDLETVAAREAAEKATWKERWEKDRVRVDLTHASSLEKAYNNEPVLAILQPKTTLREVVGEDNKPTGEYETRVKIQTKDKDGKAVTLDLDPVGAVKQLKEMPEYANLFIAPGTGGLGGGNLNRGTEKVPMHQLGTEAYIAERNKNRKKK